MCRGVRGTTVLGCLAGTASLITFKYFLSTYYMPALWQGLFRPSSTLAPSWKILLLGLSFVFKAPTSCRQLKPLPGGAAWQPPLCPHIPWGAPVPSGHQFTGHTRPPPPESVPSQRAQTSDDKELGTSPNSRTPFSDKIYPEL